MGLDFIDRMQKKRTFYLVHPNDAVAIASQVLNIIYSRQFANKVLDVLADKGWDIDIERGWKALNDWISDKLKPAFLPSMAQTAWHCTPKLRRTEGLLLKVDFQDDLPKQLLSRSSTCNDPSPC
ncbi:hypothetical protein AOLI_G00066180 [Acnodon oligacanthus]